jgi:hypothetical protein
MEGFVEIGLALFMLLMDVLGRVPTKSLRTRHHSIRRILELRI